MVRKKDGSWRFCINYRKLNAVTCRDAYLLPRIDSTLDSLAGATYFTMLDLASGYWQVAVKEQDKEKIAFSTPEGHFEFNVMPIWPHQCASHIPEAHGVCSRWVGGRAVPNLP